MLASLSPRKSVALVFMVSAPNLAGAPTGELIGVKVHGQKKAGRKR